MSKRENIFGAFVHLFTRAIMIKPQHSAFSSSFLSRILLVEAVCPTNLPAPPDSLAVRGVCTAHSSPMRCERTNTLAGISMTPPFKGQAWQQGFSTHPSLSCSEGLQANDSRREGWKEPVPSMATQTCFFRKICLSCFFLSSHSWVHLTQSQMQPKRT